jgi:hypothetical protein
VFLGVLWRSMSASNDGCVSNVVMLRIGFLFLCLFVCLFLFIGVCCSFRIAFIVVGYYVLIFFLLFSLGM